MAVPFYPARPPVPAAFTPWILGDGLIHPPMVFAGEYDVSAGGFDIRRGRHSAPNPGWTTTSGHIASSFPVDEVVSARVGSSYPCGAESPQGNGRIPNSFTGPGLARTLSVT